MYLDCFTTPATYKFRGQAVLRQRNQGRAICIFDNKNQCRDRINRIAGPNSTKETKGHWVFINKKHE